jgi:hypothetical protein
VRKANLFDELELGMLRKGWDRLSDPEHSADNVVGGISQIPSIVSIRLLRVLAL